MFSRVIATYKVSSSNVLSFTTLTIPRQLDVNYGTCARCLGKKEVYSQLHYEINHWNIADAGRNA